MVPPVRLMLELFQACSTGPEILGQIYDLLERLCLSVGIFCPTPNKLSRRKMHDETNGF